MIQNIYIAIASVFIVLLVGCQGNSRPTAAELEKSAIDLAKQIRYEMTKPAIMELPVGPTADTGLRARRQRDVAQPLMYKLMACGKAAETPLWELLTDEDESVRRTTIWMMNIRIPWKDDEGNRINDETIAELNIPLMERALSSDDPQLRFFACGGLGDCANSFSGCLDRLWTSLPLIAELKQDPNDDVRAVAEVSYKSLLWNISERAASPEHRKAAAAELQKLEEQEHPQGRDK